MKDTIDYIDEWFQENEVMNRNDYDDILIKIEKENKCNCKVCRGKRK